MSSAPPRRSHLFLLVVLALLTALLGAAGLVWWFVRTAPQVQIR